MNTTMHHPLRWLAVAAALACGTHAAWAIDVGNEADLRAAIFGLRTGGDSSINLTANITLTRSLPMIAADVALDGGGFTIDANNLGRVLFVQAGTASVSNLTIANALAQGGAGGGGKAGTQAAGSGGGGGLGAGAAVFVGDGATAQLSNVAIGNAQAVGGAGGSVTVLGSGVAAAAGGGGGLGGPGGAGNASSGGNGNGGGGGYAGAGGAGDSSSGGGGGEFGAGGGGYSGPFVAGGGGGGRVTDGGSPPNNPGVAGSGGAPEGGQGDGSAGQNFGGGGGGLYGGPGGSGGLGGGGGGGGTGLTVGGSGGAYGGGGASLPTGGAGGYGAGGGGALSWDVSGTATSAGGAGGLGGGGGGGITGGVAGGHGGAGGEGGAYQTGAGGGGGAALGGAVFVARGGTLMLDGAAFTGTYAVTPGAGGADGGSGTYNGQPGQALGTLMFLDNDGMGNPGIAMLKVDSGTLAVNGGGALAGTSTLWKAGAGTLEINGANPGFTGTLGVNAGLLGGTGSLGGRVEVSSTARLAPGSGGAGTLGVGHLTFALNGGLNVDLGTASDRVEVAGDLTLNGGAAINVTAGPGFGPGTYTVITYGGARSGPAFTVGIQPAGYTVAVSTATQGEINLNVQAITYPVTATPGAGGTASCTPNPVAHGSDAACTATPDAGYTFAGWGGDCTGTGACTFTGVTGARSVTAAFAPITSYTGPLPGGGSATATVASPSGTCVFTHAQFVPSAFVAAAPPAQVSLVADLFDFALQGCAAGEEATITLTYPALPPGAQYWKYGPRPGPLAADWYHYPSPHAAISGNVVTLRITDGGLGDDDLDATNGRIVDAGGPALLAAVPGGAAAIPTLSQWGVLLLTLILVVFSLQCLSIKRK